VRIGLVADVPNQPVARRIEYVVQSHGELDHTQPGAQMAARYRDGADGLLAQFIRELAQRRLIETAQIGRGADLVEQRR
jgi:hypothetical protein